MPVEAEDHLADQAMVARADQPSGRGANPQSALPAERELSARDVSRASDRHRGESFAQPAIADDYGDF